MTRIYLIRHAEAEGNLYRRAQGFYDSDITPRGRLQLKALSKRFENIRIDAVYSSDITRAINSSMTLAAQRGLTPIIDTRLKEYNLGKWEDMTWGEIEWLWPDSLITFNNDPFNWKTDGSETFLGVRRRMNEAIADIAAKNEGKTVAVFTHGCALRCYISGLINGSEGGAENVPHSDNTNVSLVEYENGLPKLIINSDCSHIGEDISTFAHQKWWRDKTTLDSSNLRFEAVSDQTFSQLVDYIRETEQAFDLRYTSEDSLRSLVKELTDSYEFSVLIAYARDIPAGCIILDTKKYSDENIGLISFMYMNLRFRGSGMAVQLIGEAISRYRALGRDKLRMLIKPSAEKMAEFLKMNDFNVISENGNIIFERKISLR